MSETGQKNVKIGWATSTGIYNTCEGLFSAECVGMAIYMTGDRSVYMEAGIEI